MPPTLDLLTEPTGYASALIATTPEVFERAHPGALAFVLTAAPYARQGWCARLSLPQPGSQYDLGRAWVRAVATGQGAARYAILAPGLFEAESRGARHFFQVTVEHGVEVLPDKYSVLNILRDHAEGIDQEDDRLFVDPPRPAPAIPAPLLEYSPGLLCGCGHTCEAHRTGGGYGHARVLDQCGDPFCACDGFAPAEDLPVAGAELDDDDDDDELEAEAAFQLAFGYDVGRITEVCRCLHVSTRHLGATGRCAQSMCLGCSHFELSVENTIMADINARWLRVAPPAVQALSVTQLRGRDAIPTAERCVFCEGHGTTLGTAGDRGNPTCDECNGTGRRQRPAAPRQQVRDEWGLLKKIAAATKAIPGRTLQEEEDRPPEGICVERFGLLELDDGKPVKKGSR